MNLSLGRKSRDEIGYFARRKQQHKSGIKNATIHNYRPDLKGPVGSQTQLVELKIQQRSGPSPIV